MNGPQKISHLNELEPRSVLKIIASLGLDFKGDGFGQYYPRNAWAWLVYCILSLRTKDEVSQAAYQRLAAQVPDIDAMIEVPVEDIARLIYPCGFYQRKADQLKKIALIVKENYNGEPPKTSEELFCLPGVGLKTANFVLSRGYNLPAICVDIHVHRISNRLGWVKTTTPEETEMALKKIVPQDLWTPLNSLIVPFGQHICRPVSPHCDRCPFGLVCPKIPFKTPKR